MKTKKLQFTILIAAFVAVSLFGFSSTGWAATYYVDATPGADCSSNYSIANRNCSGSDGTSYDTLTEAVAVATTAGDTVYIRSGTYNERLLPAASGTSNDPITFEACKATNACGVADAMPVIDGTGLGLTGFAGIIDTRAKNYIIVDGLEVRNSTGSIYRSWNDIGSILRNSVLHDNLSSNRDMVNIWYGANALIDNNHVYNCGSNCIQVISSTNVKVRYNNVHDGITHVGINVFPDTAGTQELYSGNDILYNRITRCRVGIYTRWQRNNKIIGNVVYNVGDPNDSWMHGNGQGLVMGYHPTRGARTYVANTEVYNNTIVDNGYHGFRNQSALNIIAKNNIIANNGTAQILFDARTSVAGHDLDYNHYYDDNNLKLVWNGTTYSSLSAFRSASLQEANGLDEVPIFRDISKNDYRLVPESTSLIDRGEDLSSAGVTTDINGTPRPIGSGFDIGAFELSGNNTDTTIPSAPLNLLVIQ
jgi:hypothetical protein